jgi:hypothetical protein
MDQGNMPDGLIGVWPNGCGDMGDESCRYLCFLATAMFFLPFPLLASSIYNL